MMEKIRIRGGIKHFECSSCNAKADTYWTFKDQLFQCDECNEIYVIVQQDILYGDMEKQLEKTCISCGKLLKEHLQKYNHNHQCECGENKLAFVDEDKDIYLSFYNVFP